jgi:tripartite-type tricarboxylate transporter receptor subunit TctC
MPAGTPADITAKMNAEVNKLLAKPETQEAILAQGAEPKAMSIAEFDKMYRADFSNSKAVVEASGATIQ